MAESIRVQNKMNIFSKLQMFENSDLLHRKLQILTWKLEYNLLQLSIENSSHWPHEKKSLQEQIS